MSEAKKTILSYKVIISYFSQHGCNIEEIQNLINICPDLLLMSEEELEKKVSLLFNADILYGIIICNKNEWKEYLCYETNKKNSVNNCSYITQNFIDTVNKQYIQNILQIDPHDTLEDKLYKFKKASFNSSGYKLK